MAALVWVSCAWEKWKGASVTTNSIHHWTSPNFSFDSSSHSLNPQKSTIFSFFLKSFSPSLILHQSFSLPLVSTLFFFLQRILLIPFTFFSSSSFQVADQKGYYKDSFQHYPLSEIEIYICVIWQKIYVHWTKFSLVLPSSCQRSICLLSGTQCSTENNNSRRVKTHQAQSADASDGLGVIESSSERINQHPIGALRNPLMQHNFLNIVDERYVSHTYM